MLPFTLKDASGGNNGDARNSETLSSSNVGGGGGDLFSGWLGGGGSSSAGEPVAGGGAAAHVADPICPTLSRRQRLMGFATCAFGGAICLWLASFFLPVLVLKARKFALLFSLGSVLVMAALGFLRGPWAFCRHLATRERLPYVAAYLGSLALTLYGAMHLRRALPTTAAAILQVAALAFFAASYVPGGLKGLRILLKLSWAALTGAVLPVVTAAAPRLM